MDAPVALQALQLLLHASLTAAVIQWAVLKNLQCCLALLIGQHCGPVSAHQALAHDAEARAALLVLVAHLVSPQAVHRRPPAMSAQSRQAGGADHGAHHIIWRETREELDWEQPNGRQLKTTYLAGIQMQAGINAGVA